MSSQVECPEDGCDFTTDTEHGVKIHISAKHSFDKTIICEYCGEEKEFPDRNPTELEDKKYCSRECTQNAIAERRKSRVTLECEKCGSEFEEVKSREDRAKYCSEDCRIEAFTEVGLEKGEETRFDEGHEPWNKGLSIEKSEKIQEIARKTQEAQLGINHNPGVGFQPGEEHRNWKDEYTYTKKRGENWGPQRLKALNRDDHTCQKCDKTKSELDLPLDVHHIKPYREFESDKRANRVENLISLCRSCHMKVESNSAELEEIKQ